MTTLRGVFRISGLMVSNHPDSRFPLRRNAGVFMPENSLNTVLQISEDICISFLMITAILIKRHLMIMNKDALIVFNRIVGNAMWPLFSRA